jgi:predicted nucleic acid-binding protein
MRFWDSSAIVPLLVGEASTDAVAAELERDRVVVTWWATEVECVSALTRLEREEALEAVSLTAALRRLGTLAAAWHEVEPIPLVRATAVRLLRVHPLRAADALQLAAAIVVAEDSPSALPFVTLDERLAAAAEREAFPVIRPG